MGETLTNKSICSDYNRRLEGKLLVNPLVVIAITTAIGILLTMAVTAKYYASKDIYAASRESAMQDVKSSEKASDVIIEGVVQEEPSNKGNKMDVF